MLDLVVNFDDPHAKNDFLREVGASRGKQRVRISQYRNKYSDQQMRYYFGCVVTPFQEFLGEQGEHHTKDDVHRILKYKFLRKSAQDPQTGELLAEIVPSIKSLDVVKMSRYIDDCIRWLWDTFRVPCPDPRIYLNEPAKGAA
jgi:hypothetical protein